MCFDYCLQGGRLCSKITLLEGPVYNSYKLLTAIQQHYITGGAGTTNHLRRTCKLITMSVLISLESYFNK